MNAKNCDAWKALDSIDKQVREFKKLKPCEEFIKKHLEKVCVEIKTEFDTTYYYFPDESRCSFNPPEENEMITVDVPLETYQAVPQKTFRTQCGGDLRER